MLQKDYRQIYEDIKNENFILLKPMDVRRLLRLKTNTTYELFNSDSFPSTTIGGKNCITKEKLIKWYEKEYAEFL